MMSEAITPKLKIKIMKRKLSSKLFLGFVMFSAFSFCYSQEKEPLVRNWVIPARDAHASTRLIDLSDYYTAALDDDWLVSAGANLKRLPKGIQEFEGVKFDIRGIVQLGGASLYQESDYPVEEQKIKYPVKVPGIKINQKASVIHFLHASAWPEENDKEVGQYVVHYKDGTSETIPLKYLDVLRDWWFAPGDEMPVNASRAWTGLNDITEKRGLQIALYDYKWKNPFRDKTIASIDYISTLTNAAPFLIAISLVK
jgi:beta-galactosidase